MSSLLGGGGAGGGGGGRGNMSPHAQVRGKKVDLVKMNHIELSVTFSIGHQEKIICFQRMLTCKIFLPTVPAGDGPGGQPAAKDPEEGRAAAEQEQFNEQP